MHRPHAHIHSTDGFAQQIHSMSCFRKSVLSGGAGADADDAADAAVVSGGAGADAADAAPVFQYG